MLGSSGSTNQRKSTRKFQSESRYPMKSSDVPLIDSWMRGGRSVGVFAIRPKNQCIIFGQNEGFRIIHGAVEMIDERLSVRGLVIFFTREYGRWFGD